MNTDPESNPQKKRRKDAKSGFCKRSDSAFLRFFGRDSVLRGRETSVLIRTLGFRLFFALTTDLLTTYP
jgi:hypothetical protein